MGLRSTRATISALIDSLLPGGVGTQAEPVPRAGLRKILHDLVSSTQTLDDQNVSSTSAAITAGAGGGAGNAVALTSDYNNITTVTSEFDSVSLPPALAGLTITVKNSGGNIASLFPATGDNFDALAANLSVDLPIGSKQTFHANSAAVWESNETLYVHSPTTQTGGFGLQAVANAANHDVLIKNASHGQTSIHTLPDPGSATAEIILDKAAQTISGVKTYTASPRTTVDVGVVSGTGITVIETGDVIHKTVFTIAAHRLTVTDAGGNGGHGSQKIYDFPEGHIKLISGHVEITVFSAVGTGAADSGVVDIGIGSTATATDNEVLSATEQDFVTKIDTTLNGSGDLSGTVNATLSTDASFDGSSTAIDIFLNAAITATTISANEDFDVTGVVTICWINQGNDG